MIDFEEGTEDFYRMKFQKMRWNETEGAPVCPWCESRSVYVCHTLYMFKCKKCNRQFSVTTGTIFRGRKLSFEVMVKAIEMAQEDRHLNAWQFSRALFISYKSAYVLSRKIVEALNKDGLSSPPSTIWKGYWQRSFVNG